MVGRLCGVNTEGEDGEDTIMSARLLQFVTPAVVFSQPPRAACAANSLIIAPFLALRPCGQLQQMGALSRVPQPPPPPGPPGWGPRPTCTRKDGVHMTHNKESRGEGILVFPPFKCYCGFTVLNKQQPHFLSQVWLLRLHTRHCTLSPLIGGK